MTALREPPSTMRMLARFVAVAFGFSWAVAVAIVILDPPLIARVVLLALFMWGPALGALAAQRAARTRVFAPLAVVFAPNRWWLVAWLAPLVSTAAVFAVGAALPGVTVALDAGALLATVPAGVSEADLAQARASIDSVPFPALVLLLIGQALVAGISVNALAAFGEELGWRGFLHVQLARLGFWRRAVVVGVLWGVWHAPIILLGQNYPAHPVAGVFMMIAFTTLLAAPFDLVRERSGSVVAASVLHGSLNASAGFAVVFVRGGSDLLIGFTGLAGLLVLAALNLAVLRLRGK